VEYQKQVIANAGALANKLVEHGFNLVSGGTDNHLMLVDLRNKGITGKDAEQRLDAIGVTVNKNAVPFDTESPLVTSGIRIGTPAVTSRGFGQQEMGQIADIINLVVTDNAVDKARILVQQLCERFAFYC
jgi:glycine hydroxymethyltransferase